MPTRFLASLERKGGAFVLFLILSLWCLFCVTDVNHPPGTRTVRILVAFFIVMCGVLEARFAWAGFSILLLIWPHVLVIRELLSRASDAWQQFPQFWAGALTASIGLGFLFRTRNSQNSAMDIDRESRVFTAGTCSILFSMVLASALCMVRLSGHPAGWVVAATDPRHMLSSGITADYRPMLLLIEYIPPYVVGILLLRAFYSGAIHIPIRRLSWLSSASGALVAVELIMQIGGWGAWAFDMYPPSASFSHRNLASPILILYAAGLLALADEMRGWRYAAALACAVMFVIPASLNGSRNGLVSGGVLFGLWLAVGNMGRKMRFSMIAVCGLLTALFVYSWVTLKDNPNAPPTLRRINETIAAISNKDMSTASSYRGSLYNTATQIFMKYPLGAGVGTFPMLASEGAEFRQYVDADYYERTATHSHSMIFQALHESGILGVLGWCAIWIAVPVLLMIRYKTHRMWFVAALMVAIVNVLDTPALYPGMLTFSIIILMGGWSAARDSRRTT